MTLPGGTDVPHYIVQRTQTPAKPGVKSHDQSTFHPRRRNWIGSLTLLAVLFAGPMLANPGTHSAAFSVGLIAAEPSDRQVHQASIVDDIVDVIDDIIDDLIGDDNDGGRGGAGGVNP